MSILEIKGVSGNLISHEAGDFHAVRCLTELEDIAQGCRRGGEGVFVRGLDYIDVSAVRYKHRETHELPFLIEGCGADAANPHGGVDKAAQGDSRKVLKQHAHLSPVKCHL